MAKARRAQKVLGAIPIAMALTLIASSTGSAQPGPQSSSDSPAKGFTINGRHINVTGIDKRLLPSLLKPGTMLSVMVELAGDPVATKQSAARTQGRKLSDTERSSARGQVKSNQDRIRPQIEAQGGEVLSQMQDAYNGMRVRIDSSKLTTLTAISGVKGVHELPTYELDNINGAQYVNANDVWTDLGTTGVGTKIAIIDTGVDYTHADFGGSGNPADFAHDNPRKRGTTFPTPKVIEGHDFVGDAYDASAPAGDPRLIPHPDADPIDCNGHGSHVAGTAAGFGVLSNGSTFTGPYDANTYTSHSFEIGPGVAPNASILAYKVFGCAGSTNVVVEAINQAVVDGANVISMSLGAPYGTKDNPDSVAVENATSAGVVVVAAAGNSGNLPYVLDSPGAADHAIAVAAVDAAPTIPAANIALSGPTNLLAINANDSTIPGGGITAPLLVLDGSGPSGAGPDGIGLGCDPGDFSGASGKIVVTQRGVCARVDRAINGQAAGAVAVIMVNNAAGLPPFDGEVDGLTIPFLGVGDEHAGDLKSRNGQSATITDNGTVASPQFGVLASFTSSGPRTGDSAMKPDVTAPGVSVKSVAMGTGTQGTYISGTSMATPHTSGVAALVIAGHPTWTPTQVRAAIMNNANPDLITDPSVLLAGGGAADALDAIDSKILAMTENQGASLSFGYQVLTGAFSATKTVTLSNFSGSPVHVDASLDVQDGLDYSIAVSPTAVTVPAASSGQPGQATMNVTISLTQAQAASLPFAEDAAPSGETDITIRSARGGVTLTPATGPVLRVPYLLVPRAASDIVAQPVTVAATNTAPVSQNVSIENRGIHDGAAEVLAWTNTDPADTSGQAVDIRGVGVEVLPGNFLGLQNKDKSLLFAVNSWNQWSTANGEAEFDIGIDTKGGPAPDYFVFGYDLGQLLFDAFDGTYASFVVTAQGELIDVWLADAPINGSTILLPAAASDLGLTKGGANQLRITDVAGFSLQDGSVFDPVAIAKNHRPTIHPWSSPLDQGFGYSIPAGGSDSAALKFKNSAKTDNLLGWMFVTMDDRNGPAQADVIKFPK